MKEISLSETNIKNIWLKDRNLPDLLGNTKDNPCNMDIASNSDNDDIDVNEYQDFAADEDFSIELYGSTEDLLGKTKDVAIRSKIDDKSCKDFTDGTGFYSRSPKEDLHSKENIRVKINRASEKVHYFVEEKNGSQEDLILQEHQRDLNLEDINTEYPAAKVNLLYKRNGIRRQSEDDEEEQNLLESSNGEKSVTDVAQMMGQKITTKHHRTKCILGVASVMIVVLLLVIIVIVIKDAVQTSEFYDNQESQYHYRGNTLCNTLYSFTLREEENFTGF